MTIRVLIVDDSQFICNRIREALEEDPDFCVIGVAVNGQEAVELSLILRPDVVTMDVNMPVMDGITAVKKIMSNHPCPILMFSAMTQVGAKATLDALQAGAIDFLPKQWDEIDSNREIAKNLFRQRVRLVASQVGKLSAHSDSRMQSSFAEKLAFNIDSQTVQKKSVRHFGRVNLLAIAASTGGPVAIQQVLSQIPRQCSVPVLIMQHMPQNFTKSFADRLNQLCQIQVKEAENGDVLQAGRALLGPGGMQMQIKYISGQHQVMLRPKQTGEIYSPCIDTTFYSLAEQFKGHILAVILTGMGADGKEGAIKLKQKGAEIWAQDEASSTIYGMPRAIVEANIADKIYSLDEIANAFKTLN
ncbi:chemotaxis response regulator protein-glutamate methylesterase [Methylomonas sp. AM2-LC]|uniref:protein-glutamate methylesterase/protein-glutamine glutaminase n=1 Tax=Methylomonas sp. AM2-LC TaxID=3153301 RepID=UPI003263FC2D